MITGETFFSILFLQFRLSLAASGWCVGVFAMWYTCLCIFVNADLAHMDKCHWVRPLSWVIKHHVVSGSWPSIQQRLASHSPQLGGCWSTHLRGCIWNERVNSSLMCLGMACSGRIRCEYCHNGAFVYEKLYVDIAIVTRYVSFLRGSAKMPLFWLATNGTGASRIFGFQTNQTTIIRTWGASCSGEFRRLVALLSYWRWGNHDLQRIKEVLTIQQ